MSYLSKPGAPVVHIADLANFSGTRTFADGEHRVLEALCPAYFIDPRFTPYFNGRKRGQRVCGHCQRIAVRTATRLLNEAQGATP